MTDNTNGWHMSKQVSLALVFAVFMQTVAAVWWAAGVDTKVEFLGAKVEDQIDRQGANLHEFITSQQSENLRLWNRINKNETDVQDAISLQRTTQAILERVEKGLAQTQEDISKQNELLREFLSEN